MVTPSSGPGQTEWESDGLHSTAEGCQVLTEPFKKKFICMQHLLIIISNCICAFLVHVHYSLL